MSHYACACGAKYRFPDSAVGKKAKCKKCGAVFTLAAEEEEILRIADEDPMVAESAMAAERIALAEVAAARAQGVAPGHAKVVIERDEGANDTPAVSTHVGLGFGSDVLWTFLFPASPGNLIAFVAIWIGLAIVAPVLSFIPLLGFVVEGWYSAFRFGVLRSATAGEEDLPDVNFTNDIFEDFLRPMFQWIASWLVILLPAFAYLIYAVSQGTIDGFEAIGLAFGGLDTMLSGSTSGLMTFDILIYVGLFLWPMVALCIALGGLPSLYRMDLILLTIGKTFPMYSITLVMLYGAVFVQGLLMKVAGAGIMGKTQSGSLSWPAPRKLIQSL